MKKSILLIGLLMIFNSCSQTLNLNRVNGIKGPNAPVIEGSSVLFRLDAPGASLVTIAGNFNGWNSQTTPLEKGTNGIWSIQLPLPAGQKYYYKFVLDGYWLADPDNPNTENSPGGGVLSIINLK